MNNANANLASSPSTTIAHTTSTTRNSFQIASKTEEEQFGSNLSKLDIETANDTLIKQEVQSPDKGFGSLLKTEIEGGYVTQLGGSEANGRIVVTILMAVSLSLTILSNKRLTVQSTSSSLPCLHSILNRAF